MAMWSQWSREGFETVMFVYSVNLLSGAMCMAKSAFWGKEKWTAFLFLYAF